MTKARSFHFHKFVMAGLFLWTQLCASIPAQADMLRATYQAALETGEALGRRIVQESDVEKAMASVTESEGLLYKDAYNELKTGRQIEAAVAGLEKAGAPHFVDARTGELVFYIHNSEGKVVQLMRIPKPTPEAVAKESPSKIREMLKTLAQAGIGTAFKRKFLPETLTFMIAQGAVSTYEMTFDYANNPGAWDQFLDSSVNVYSNSQFHSGPIWAQASFAAFWGTQNAGSALMLKAFHEKPKLRQFGMPSFAMTAGMAASKIVDGIRAAQPNLYKAMRNCHSQYPNEENIKACDEAYTAWVEYWHSSFIVDGAIPAVVGLITPMFGQMITRYLGGMLVNASLSKAMDWSAGRILSVVVMLTFSEEAIPFKVFMYSMQVANLGMFMFYSDKIENGTLKFMQRHVSTGRYLLAAEEKLNEDQMKGDWHAMSDDVDEYQKRAQEWAQSSAMDPLSANANWNNFLSGFLAEYLYSEKVYSKVVESLWNNRQPENKNNQVDFFAAYPLFGVKASNGKEIASTEYITNAPAVQAEQLSSLQKIAKEFRVLYPQDHYYYDLTISDRTHLNYILAHIESGKVQDAAQGLLHLEMEFKKSQNLVSTWSPLGTQVIRDLYYKIGKPEPQLIPGMGFLRLVQMQIEGGESPLLSPRIGAYSSENNSPVDHYIWAMLSGPDVEKGEAITSTGDKYTYIATFKPPKIRVPEFLAGGIIHQYNTGGVHDDPLNIYQGSLLNTGLVKVALDPMATSSPFDQHNIKNYMNPLQYLVTGGLRPSVLATKMVPSKDKDGKDVSLPDSAFGDWWTKYVEPPYVQAWQDYDRKYQTIVNELKERLETKDSVTRFINDFWREGSRNSLPLGLIDIHRMELSTYLSLVRLQLDISPDDADLKAVSAAFDALANSLHQMKSANMTERGQQDQRLVILNPVSRETFEAQFDVAAKAVEKLVSHYRDLPAQKYSLYGPPLKKIAGNIVGVFSNLKSYAMIMNAVSYQWNNKDGFFENKSTGLTADHRTNTILHK